MRRFLEDSGAPEDDSFEALLAVDEALSNACKHGARPAGGSIAVRCFRAADEVVIQVIDDGFGFRPERLEVQHPPDPFAMGGRGIFLMNQLMDKVDISSGDSGTVVTMARTLRPVRRGEMAGAR